MSEVSICPATQPGASPLAVCVTIRSAPGASVAGVQPVKVQVSTWTATASTVTVADELFTMRTAPASNTQADTGAQPRNTVFGEPAHGVGKFATSARRLSA